MFNLSDYLLEWMFCLILIFIGKRRRESSVDLSEVRNAQQSKDRDKTSKSRKELEDLQKPDTLWESNTWI